MRTRLFTLALFFGAALGAAAQSSSRADADSMAAKVERAAAVPDRPRVPGAPPLRTSFTEREINAYLEHYGAEVLPAGISRPRATLAENDRVAARAVVDLSAVAGARERSLLDPLAYLQGSLEVVIAAEVEGDGGRGVIRFGSATVGGVAVPKTVAQELLKFYTRTAARPQGFQFDEPFDLPARIQSVRVEPGAIPIAPRSRAIRASLDAREHRVPFEVPLVRVAAATGERLREHFAEADLRDLEQAPARFAGRLVVDEQLIHEELRGAAHRAEIVRLADPQPARVLEAEQPLVRDREADLRGQRRVVVDFGRRRHRSSLARPSSFPELRGVLIGGLTLEELAALARLRVGGRVSVLRPATLADFRAELALVNDVGRRYIANFHRGPLFGRVS